MKKGRIFVVSAPSGSGKTTICQGVLKRVKGLASSVSVTTRKPRRGEKNRKDYRYLSRGAFKKEIKKRGFLEWEENFGHLYGTPKRFVIDKIKAGKDVLLSIDVKGAMNVKKKFRGCTLIFIKPPSMRELSRRLESRNTDGKAEISKRLAIAKNEIGYSARYDHVVVNRDLDKAIEKVVGIIREKRSS